MAYYRPNQRATIGAKRDQNGNLGPGATPAPAAGVASPPHDWTGFQDAFHTAAAPGLAAAAGTNLSPLATQIPAAALNPAARVATPMPAGTTTPAGILAQRKSGALDAAGAKTALDAYYHAKKASIPAPQLLTRPPAPVNPAKPVMTPTGMQSQQPSQSGPRMVGTLPNRVPPSSTGQVIDTGVTAYDQRGNRQTQTVGSGGAPSLEYDPAHDMSRPIYHAQGNGSTVTMPGVGPDGTATQVTGGPALPPGAARGVMIDPRYQMPGHSPMATITAGSVTDGTGHSYDPTTAAVTADPYHTAARPAAPALPGASMAANRPPALPLPAGLPPAPPAISPAIAQPVTAQTMMRAGAAPGMQLGTPAPTAPLFATGAAAAAPHPAATAAPTVSASTSTGAPMEGPTTSGLPLDAYQSAVTAGNQQRDTAAAAARAAAQQQSASNVVAKQSVATAQVQANAAKTPAEIEQENQRALAGRARAFAGSY